MKKLTRIISGLGLVATMAITAECADINISACAGCHGVAFQKSALGKSKIVKDMNTTDISKALIGYKDGTYGGVMKGLMKGQISKYSDTELKEIATKITQQ